LPNIRGLSILPVLDGPADGGLSGDVRRDWEGVAARLVGREK
jgi:hypothetical protein